MQSDRELMEGILQGDEPSFDAFFARYRQAVRLHVVQMVRDEIAAEDLTHEVFLRVWTKADQWQEKGEARAWLYRIATNLAINHLGRKLRQSLVPAGFVDAGVLHHGSKFRFSGYGELACRQDSLEAHCHP